MKNSIFLLLISGLILFAPGNSYSALPGDIDADFDSGKLTVSERLTLKALMLTDPDSLPEKYRLDRPLKDGTMLIRDIVEHWDEANQRFKERFSFLLTRVNKQKYFDTPSGFFRIHYDTTGGHAVYQAGIDVNPPDGVPDYVNRTAEYFDLAWRYQCDTLGYDTPPFDGSNGGGNDLYDVYMHHYSGAYGVTFSENSSYQRPGRNYDYTSYIYVDPTYAGFGYADRTLPMKVTSAHEFFHAVQFAYNVNAGSWYMENCATWMEDIIWDGINDNYAYLFYFLNYPHYALTTANGGFEYGGFIWPMFLYENWGHDFIRQTWEYSINVPALAALDQVCANYGTFLEEQYVIFSLWNYLTNYRDDGNHYEEGGSYNLARTMRTHTSYPVDNMSSSSRPNALGCNYISFVNSGQSGDLHIVFDGQDSQLWYLQIIKASANNSHTYDIINLDSQNDGEYTVEDFGQYEWVAIITDIIQGANGNYSYSAYLEQTSVDEQSPVLPEEITLNGNYPNPFNSETVVSIFSPRQEPASIAVYDIKGRMITNFKINLIAGENLVPVNFNDNSLDKTSSGVLYYAVETSSRKLTGKMLFLK